MTDNGALVFSLSNAAATVANAVSGVGSLTQAGTGILTLSGSNTYGGGTTIDAGTLKLGTSASLPSGTAVTDYGTLDLGSFAATVAALTGTGTVNHSGTGSSTLTVGSGAFSGAGKHRGNARFAQDRSRPIGPQRQQHLSRRHDGLRRHALRRQLRALAAGTSLTVGSSGSTSQFSLAVPLAGGQGNRGPRRDGCRGPRTGDPGAVERGRNRCRGGSLAEEKECVGRNKPRSSGIRVRL